MDSKFDEKGWLGLLKYPLLCTESKALANLPASK